MRRSTACGLLTAALAVACAGPAPACIEDCIAEDGSVCPAAVHLTQVDALDAPVRCESSAAPQLCNPRIEANVVSPTRVRIQDRRVPDLYGDFAIVDLASASTARVCVQHYDDLMGDSCGSMPCAHVGPEDPWTCAVDGDVILELDGGGELDVTFPDGTTLGVRWLARPCPWPRISSGGGARSRRWYGV